MEYRCPYCGEKIHDSQYCMSCEKDVRWAQKIYKKSKTYLVRGYKEAASRNLTKAAAYLKKSIYFNKYNTDARNLLGLVYFERGKISLALKEWIISSALDKEDHRAKEYIDQIQEAPKVLVTYKESINLYNKALLYLKQNNHDVAIIRLKKAVSLNPNLIEARNLLSLCYIREKQFYKANEQLKEVLKIDRDNTKALIYFKSVSQEDTESIRPYELEYIPKQSKKQASPSKVMDRGAVLAKHVIYFVIGASCMFFVEASLILPSKIQDYKSQIAHITESESKLSNLLEEERKQNKEQLLVLEEANKKLSEEKQNIELASSKMLQQTRLKEADQLKNEKKWVQSAEVLYNIAPSLLEEEEVLTYNQLKTDVYALASKLLYEEGYKYFAKGDLVEAKTQLEKAVVYGPSENIMRKVLYYLGRIEKEQNNKDKAIYYFNKVIGEYPKTNEAYWAEAEIEKLN